MDALATIYKVREDEENFKHSVIDTAYEMCCHIKCIAIKILCLTLCFIEYSPLVISQDFFSHLT